MIQIQTYIHIQIIYDNDLLKSQRDLRVEEAKSACAASRASATFVERSTSSFDKPCVLQAGGRGTERARQREEGAGMREGERKRGTGEGEIKRAREKK